MDEIMGWIEPISGGLKAIKLADELRKSAPFARKQFTRLYKWLKNGSVILPVFGGGGVGKTTVGRILTGDDPFSLGAPYKESWINETYTLNGEVPGRILVAPGQKQRVESQWPTLLDEVNDGKTLGIINVVCYGYHSIGTFSFQGDELWQDGRNVEEVLVEYTRKKREDELVMLSALLRNITLDTRPFLFVTLVTKQDLWWHKRKEVESFYTQGLYSRMIDDFRKKQGSSVLQHELIPVSLIVENFRSPSGELIQPISEGYDQATHLTYLQSMITSLATAMESFQKVR